MRSAISRAVTELGAQHPLLLFERPHDLDQDVLGREVDLAESIHSVARPLADLGDAMRELAHDHVIVDRRVRDRRELRAAETARRLPVGNVAECDRALGDCVGELAPGIHELVEVQVERPEQRSDHGPVQLLADQREVDELVQGRLEHVADLLVLVRLVEDGRCVDVAIEAIGSSLGRSSDAASQRLQRGAEHHVRCRLPQHRRRRQPPRWPLDSERRQN